MDDPFKAAKLAKLVESEGYENVDDLLEAFICDSVAPAICMNLSCDYTTEMEPDQEQGYCEVCDTNSLMAAPVLAGVI